jgi:uncharacterized protein involved in exopolysaccharide biosynthesis
MDQPLDSWEDDSRSSIAWTEILGIAIRHRWLIGIVFAIGTSVASVIAFRPAPVYRATAKLMVSADRARVRISPDAGSASVVGMVSAQDLNGEVAMLRSESLVREVLERHRGAEQPVPVQGWVEQLADLATRPADWPVMLYARFHGVAPLTGFEARVRFSTGRTNAYAVRQTNLIEVTHESEDPVWAAQFVNELVEHHVDRHTTLYQQAEAREFIGSQRELLSKRLEKAEEELRQFSQREATDSVPDQRVAVRAQLADLQLAMDGAQRDLAESQARASFLQRSIQSQTKQLDADGPRQHVYARLLELQLQRSELLAQFAPTSIRVRDIEGQIAEAQRLVNSDAMINAGAMNPTLATELTQTQAHLAAVGARIEALQSQVIKKAAQLTHLDEIASEYDRLDEDVTSARESLANYRRKEEQARFSVALDESRIVNVDVVERAEVPLAPLPSRAAMRLIIGAVVSLVLAAALAYVRDRFDPAVKTAAEAGRITRLPVLANISSS